MNAEIRTHRPFVPPATRVHSGKVTRPRYESAPYRVHPGRREFIHGRIQPLDEPARPLWHSLLIVGLFAVVVFLTVTRGWQW